MQCVVCLSLAICFAAAHAHAAAAAHAHAAAAAAACVLSCWLQTGGTPQEPKTTAWQEWKGQVIHQGFAAERAGPPQRSASEAIAEAYDARI